MYKYLLGHAVWCGVVLDIIFLETMSSMLSFSAMYSSLKLSQQYIQGYDVVFSDATNLRRVWLGSCFFLYVVEACEVVDSMVGDGWYNPRVYT